MAKKDKEDFSPAEDYLAQVEWHNSNKHRRISAFYEPKWRYKIIYGKSSKPSALFPAILTILMIGFMAYMLYQIIVDRSGGAVFGLVLFGLVFTILFFAIRDIKKEDK